jgi:hypothetical protein
MAIIALCVPILPGKKDKWQEMMDKLNAEPMKSVINATRADAGVHERTFLQETPAGDFVVITLEGDDPAAAFGKMMADERLKEFGWEEWAAEVHGMTADAPPPAIPKLIYDSKG